MADLAPDWEDLNRRVDAIVAATEATVVRHEWARWAADWETPFELWEQRFGRNPIRTAIKGSPDPSMAVRYGYDKDDRIVLARRFTKAGGKAVPDSEMVWTTGADGAPVLLRVERRWTRGAAGSASVRSVIVPDPPDREAPPEVVTTFWRPGRGVVWQQERYDRGVGGRVERITDTNRYDESHSDGAHERQFEYVVTYDDLGAMERMTSRLLVDTSNDRGPGEVVVTWVRSDTAAVRDAEAFLARELPGRIVEWVRKNDPKVPVYALGVLYDADDGANWTPSLALATVQHLQQVGTPDSAERAERAWNPAGFPVFEAEAAELSSPEMIAAFRITGQEWGDRSAKKVAALLKKVAKEVGGPARDALAEPVEGFGVYAAELEDDFVKVARTSLGAKAWREVAAL